MNYADLSIAEAGARMRDGRLTASRLVDDHLARIAERDARLSAFVTVTAEQARADAVRADHELQSGTDRGPLHGIPVALKDLIDTKDVRTTSGSRLFEDHLPSKDAAVVARLRQAGAVLIGKVMTYEFALVGPSFDLPFPPSRNPWNTDHITGGSSSGSAAAVAGGMVRTSIGTDTGGSIRSPASYCGIVGLKPSYDLLPRDGIFTLSPSLDHVGPLSASVADAALTLEALCGMRLAPVLDQCIAGKRIGYARTWFASDPETHPAALAAMDDAVSALSLLGARIEEVSLPDYALFEAAGAVILQAEALAQHEGLLADRLHEYGRLARQNLLSGLALTKTDVADARVAAQALRRHVDEHIFSQFDAMVTINTLTPALPFSAFDGERSVWTHMRTFPFNVTGHPVLAVPIGFSSDLPLGMQIVGKHGGEAGICTIGHAFEQATDHSTLRPSFQSAPTN